MNKIIIFTYLISFQILIGITIYSEKRFFIKFLISNVGS